jgi:hypothetical protein
MKLLGHTTAKMTLLYAEFTQIDLQREFRAARSQPRHLLPPPKTAATSLPVQPDLPGILQAIQAAQHVLEMFRRSLPETDRSSRALERLANRLARIAADLRRFAAK